LALFTALGYTAPTTFAHVPLLHDETGARLAKRDSASGLETARATGATPEQVLGRLAASGGLWPGGMPARLDELLVGFDLSLLTPPQ
jgi:glutamyl/glutaminyl-tRNA synthetase